MKRRRRRKRTNPTYRSSAVKLALVIAASVCVRLVSDRAPLPLSALAKAFDDSALAPIIVKSELAQPIEVPDESPALRLLRLELPFGIKAETVEVSEDEPVGQSVEEEPTEPDGEDISQKTQTEPAPTDENDAPAPTETSITGENGQYYMAAEGIYLKNNTDYEIDIDALLASELSFSVADGAEVLIIHTHGTEAYTPDGDDTYVPTEPFRTLDGTESVIRVGDELERVLTQRGITVTHDTGLYDYPVYNNSYSRAYSSIAQHLEENPNIKVVIDLHRDALEGADGTVYKTVADVGDAPCAQVEIIAGTNFTGLSHDNWRENLKLAMKLQAEMVTKYPSLARPLYISQYRYNQHATPGSLIIEVGCNGNTLEEALNAVTYFGDCLANVLDYEG